MPSEHLRVSVILTERRQVLNTAVFWPRSLSPVITDQLPVWLKELGGSN